MSTALVKANSQPKRNMPMARKPTAKSSEARPYGDFADRLQEWILAYRVRNPRVPYVQRDAANAMGINPTTFSKLTRGRDSATPHQCVAIAHYFGVDVDEVLRTAGYPDVKQLTTLVANDRGEHDPKERAYILNMLPLAEHPRWRETDWHTSAYKESADQVLGSELPPYLKGRQYADILYNWGKDIDRDKPRALRRTDEIMALVS